jgi:hypothetical protein
MLIIGNISIVDIILDGLGSFVIVGIFRRIFFCPPVAFEVVPEGRVISIINGLKLAVGVEAKDCTEGVKDEAEDGIGVDELAHVGVCGEVVLVLYGSQEEDQEIDGEEDADEDEDHDDLVAELVLHDVEKEEEEDAEDRLPQEGGGCHEV